MKNIILVLSAVLSFAAIQAHAQGDMLQAKIRCASEQGTQGNYTSLTLFEGGLSGIPQLSVQRVQNEQITTENYLVQLLPPIPRMMGAPTVYQGEGITLAISWLTTPVSGNGHLGTLTTQENGQPAVNETMICQRVN